MPLSTIPDFILLGVVLVGLHALLRNLTQRRRKLPPGPRPFPLLGNLLDAPGIIVPQLLDKMTGTHGDLIHLRILGRPTILVGSHELASELLGKRSANYSDRPSVAMIDLVGASWITLKYGLEWRRQRKMFHHSFNIVAVSQFHHIQERIARQLVRRLLARPTAVFPALRFAACAVTVRTVYGVSMSGDDDEYLGLVDKANYALKSSLEPGQHLVEVFPWLSRLPRWLPGTAFLRDAARWEHMIEDARSIPFGRALEDIRRRNYRLCLVSDAVKSFETNSGASAEDTAILRDAAATSYFAGTETISSHMKVFFLAMTLYPEVQRRAQAEIDTVIGHSRLPDISDIQYLPYIEAVLMESMRWKQINVLGLPHQSIAADEFRGYHLPAGSMIVPNIWAIAHNPNHYPDPFEFKPERYLTNMGTLDPEVLDPRSYMFGYGRRICSGRHFSQSSLFINIASVLHAFNIHHGGADGLKMPDIFSCPKTFDCEVSVRSTEIRALIVADDDTMPWSDD